MAVLILAYKRHENLAFIVSECTRAGVIRIYIVVDGPANPEDKHQVDKVRKVVSDFSFDAPVELKVQIRTENAGCGASVITACDWFFAQEQLGVILEDDCLPSSGFFNFMAEALPIVAQQPDIWLASGTQFFPEEFPKQEWALSRYPMHWGWGTSSDKWRESRIALEANPPSIRKFISSLRNPELIYWFAGERRAYYGYTDVWDSIYASNMFRLGKLAIVSPRNLVTNVGDDKNATNTRGVQKYTQSKISNYETNETMPTYSLSYDLTIRSQFFGISPRHYVTTLLTFVFDVLFIKRQFSKALDSRLLQHRIK